MAVSRDELVGAYQRLTETGEQAFLLSTCLRLEVLVPGDGADLERVLKTLHSEWAEAASGIRRSDGDALHHIYRVAAGVESPVVGEVEVLAQVRESVGVAREAGALYGSFRSLVEGAISAGRAAREELPESPHGSFAAIVAQLVGPHGEVAVFGAGTMARSVVTALQYLPAPPEIAIYVRRPDELAIDGVAVRSMADAVEALHSFPAVVSATSAQHRLFSVSEMRSAIGDREKPLTLVDLAMPPDFEPADIEGIRYIGIDELADRAHQLPRSFAADTVIAEAAVEAISRVRNHEKAGPVISALMVEARRAVAEEVNRFAGRLTEPNDRAVLEQLASTVAKRILHKPVSYLSSGEEGNEASDVIARAFGVEDA